MRVGPWLSGLVTETGLILKGFHHFEMVTSPSTNGGGKLLCGFITTPASKSCPGHAHVMPRSCPCHAQVMPMSCPGHAQVMPRSCPGYFLICYSFRHMAAAFWIFRCDHLIHLRGWQWPLVGMVASVWAFRVLMLF